MKNGKAAGCDGINAEMLKAGGGVLIKWIHRLIRSGRMKWFQMIGTKPL